MKSPSLFYKCLVLSLGIHAAAIWVLFVQPLFLNPALSSIFGKNVSTTVIPLNEEDIDLSEKNIALEEVFNQIVVFSPNTQQPFDFARVVSGNFGTNPTLENIPNRPVLDTKIPEGKESVFETHTTPPSLALESGLFEPPLAAETRVSPIPSQIAFDRSLNLELIQDLQHAANSLPDHEVIADNFSLPEIYFPPSVELPGAKKMEIQGGAEIASVATTASEPLLLISPDELLQNDIQFSQTPESSNVVSRPQKTARVHVAKGSTDLPSFSYYNMPQGGDVLEWTDDFDVEVRTMKEEDGKYLFSLTFLPKFDMSSRRLKQNYCFLIDRSNSIEKHRYQTFRRGVSKALASMREGDNFNILICDTKLTRLSDKPLPYTKKNLHLAEEFLEKQGAGSYFTASDIYASLAKTIPTDLPEDEMTSVILLSDGDSQAHPDKQRKAINAWLKKNEGKVALYSAAVGQNNNLTLLDMLSTLSRGYLLYSDTHSAFPRKLAKLVINLKNPLAKDTTTIISNADPSSNIKLYPSSAHLPILFSDHPYVIIGTADKLTDFTLLFEGRNKNQWLNIKKTISFAKAKESRSIEKLWTVHQAYDYFEQYLKEGKTAQMNKVNELLKSNAGRDTSYHRR